MVDGLPFRAPICLAGTQGRQDDRIPWSVMFLALFHSSLCWIASCSLVPLPLHFQCRFNATLKQSYLWAASRRDGHSPFPISLSPHSSAVTGCGLDLSEALIQQKAHLLFWGCCFLSVGFLFCFFFLKQYTALAHSVATWFLCLTWE